MFENMPASIESYTLVILFLIMLRYLPLRSDSIIY